MDNINKKNISNVISGGFCIGCGACTLGLKKGPTEIQLDSFGRLQAKLRESNTPVISSVCPFSDDSYDEDYLAEKIIEKNVTEVNEYLGRYIEIYAGYVAKKNFRDQGSSGGFTSWILSSLLEDKHVDSIIHVKPCTPNAEDSRVFKYGVSSTVNELNQGAKSHYYPVEMSEILAYIRENNGRYAVVGVPCFIKSIRLLALEEPIFKERVVFTVGLFCGHLKSTGFAEFLGLQVGIKPNELLSIDFRTKIEGRPSSSYGITVKGRRNSEIIAKTALVSDLQGADWGKGYFKYKACDFCDDLSAEVADVSVGDAWLPEYVNDSRGNNVVVVRNYAISNIIKRGIEKKDLCFTELSVEDAVASQSANVRHRREDLPYRLHLEDVKNEWRPIKRFPPSADGIDQRRRSIQELRVEFREMVPLFWQDTRLDHDLTLFKKRIRYLEKNYNKLYYTPEPFKTRLRKFARRIRNFLRKY